MSRPRAWLWPIVTGLLSGGLLFLVALPLAGLLRTTTPPALVAGLADPLVGPAARLTLFTTTASVLFVVACGTPRSPGRWRAAARPWRLLETALELPVVLPPAVAGVALLLAFGRRGLLGPALSVLGIGLPFSRAAVVLAASFVSAPFYLQAAIAAFRRVDPDLLLAARTLGASRARVFFTVAVPLSLPSLAGGAAVRGACARRVRRDAHVRGQHAGPYADAAARDLHGPRV